jgi:serine/threonine-protein kinase
VTQLFPIRVVITRAGKPVPSCLIKVQGDEQQSATTDAAGSAELRLPQGRTSARVQDGTAYHDVTLVYAAGMGRIVLNLDHDETELNDPRAKMAMPSDRYVPLSLLGRGAAGTVYRCRDTRLDRLVAIKILNEDFAASDSELSDFLTEARSLARIEHPNLIQIYDVGVHNERPFMVMQFVDGVDLESLLVKEKAIGVGPAAAAGIQLMRALEALADSGYLHRDIKPSNGLVNRKGEVRLADFGLVRPIVDFTDPRSKVFGTPAYMSPEQLQARPLGPAADIYGLGASLYHMACGVLPFDGPNPILAHIVEPAPDIRTQLPDAPEIFAELLMWMMAKEPTERPSAEEVVEHLMAVATSVAVPDARDYLPRLTPSDLGTRSGTPGGSSTLASRITGATAANVGLHTEAGTPNYRTETIPVISGSNSLKFVIAAAAVVVVAAAAVLMVVTSARPPAESTMSLPEEVPMPTPSLEAEPTEQPPPVDQNALVTATTNGARIAAQFRSDLVARIWEMNNQENEGSSPATLEEGTPEPEPGTEERTPTAEREPTVRRPQPEPAPERAPENVATTTTPEPEPTPAPVVEEPAVEVAPTPTPPVPEPAPIRVVPPAPELPVVANPPAEEEEEEEDATEEGRRRPERVRPPVSF